MAGWDFAIVLAFIAYSVFSGLRARRAASVDLEQYFLAGRTLAGWRAGLSMAATQFAADTPLLVTGMIATAGIFSLWRLWIYALAFLMLGYVLAPSWRRANVITDAQLTELRFGGRAAAVLRGVKAIYFGTVFNCVVLSFVLLAATRIAEPFLLWHDWLPSSVHGVAVDLARAIGTPLTIVGDDPSAWPADVWIRSADNLISIAAILLVTTLYSTTGGLRSVVDTDVVQLAIMLVATALFAWFIVDRVGGFGALPGEIRARFGDGAGPGGIGAEEILAITPTRAKEASLAVLGVIALQWLAQMNADGTGYLAQRVMACRSDRDARQATVWFTVTQILLRSILWIVLGLGLLLLYPPDPSLPLDAARAEREFTYVRGMAELPTPLRGLLVTAMLAALASTVDTHLNWGSSYWTNDIYKRFICEGLRKRAPSDRSLVWVARCANAVILVIALAVMTRLGSIGSAWQTSLLLGAGMGGMLVLRWLWWRITAWGELSAIVGSAVLAPLVLRLDSPPLQLLIIFAGSTAIGVAVSLARPVDPASVVPFFQRVHPPGFWAPVARLAETVTDGPRRLAVGLATAAVAALSIFSLLVAASSVLAGSPPPTWFPWRLPWLIATSVLGLALVPVWRRLARVLDPPPSPPA